jgi:hypothetical protein
MVASSSAAASLQLQIRAVSRLIDVKTVMSLPASCLLTVQSDSRTELEYDEIKLFFRSPRSAATLSLSDLFHTRLNIHSILPHIPGMQPFVGQKMSYPS